MTPQEFKAWFEGFTEALESVPTEKQWARIKERVGEIDGKPVTEHHFTTHYYPHYPHYYFYPIYAQPLGGWTTISGVTTSGPACTGVFYNSSNGGMQYQSNTLGSNEFSSLGAMNALGRADAAMLSS